MEQYIEQENLKWATLTNAAFTKHIKEVFRTIKNVFNPNGGKKEGSIVSKIIDENGV